MANFFDLDMQLEAEQAGSSMCIGTSSYLICRKSERCNDIY
jgi:hypothetical protein